MKKPRSSGTIAAQKSLDWVAIANQFSGWAASFNAQASSKEKALAILKREGILTARGKLTKRYS